jgi:hypothetical protein
MLLLDICLSNFSDLFTILIGLNFACVYFIRPRNNGNNHFLLNVIDAISGNGIARITSETNDALKEIAKRKEKIQYYHEKLANRNNEINSVLSTCEQILAKGLSKKINKLKDQYEDEIKKKTESSHLSIICGLLGGYGILILLFAAIDETEKQSAIITSFLFWSNAVMLIFSLICIVAEGDIWFKKQANSFQFKTCNFLNKIFHPYLRTAVIIFIILFIYLILSVNNIVNLCVPAWITTTNIIYISLSVNVFGFLSYLLFNYSYIGYKTVRYKKEPLLKKNRKTVDDLLQTFKSELDNLEQGEARIDTENFSSSASS